VQNIITLSRTNLRGGVFLYGIFGKFYLKIYQIYSFAREESWSRGMGSVYSLTFFD